MNGKGLRDQKKDPETVCKGFLGLTYSYSGVAGWKRLQTTVMDREGTAYMV